jgi:hypothetical protein
MGNKLSVLGSNLEFWAKFFFFPYELLVLKLYFILLFGHPALYYSIV